MIGRFWELSLTALYCPAVKRSKLTIQLFSKRMNPVRGTVSDKLRGGRSELAEEWYDYRSAPGNAPFGSGNSGSASGSNDCLFGRSEPGAKCPPDEIGEYIRDLDNLVWLDVQDPGPEELSLLFEKFGFHPLAVEDVARVSSGPRSTSTRVTCLSLRTAWWQECAGQFQPVEVDLFIGRNYLVTTHRGRLPARRSGSPLDLRGSDAPRGQWISRLHGNGCHYRRLFPVDR